MYFEKSLGIFMGAFVVWGFLMAFFFNAMLVTFKAKKDFKLLWVSGIMALSYLISDHFFDFFSGSEVYLRWFYFDLVTLVVMVLCFLPKGNRTPSPGVVYAISGLSFNALLCLLIHIDLYVKGNTSPWWFWTFYSVGINLCDLIMIVALIVDRDIVGIIRIYNSVKGWIRNSSSSWFFHKCLLNQ